MAEDNYVERLVVGINFKVDKASEEKAKSALDSLKGSAGELTKVLTGLGVAFSTLVAGSVAFSIQQSRLNVQLANEAKSLDTSIERYTSLISVFQSFGLEADQITDFLFQLQGQISGAADGSQDLIDVFNKMGVAFRDTNGNQRTAIDVFFEMADGLQQFGSAGERAAAIQKLLGENGTRLNPVFEVGTKRLLSLTDAAESSGAALSSKAAAASLELNQKLTALRATTGELGRAFASELIPKIIPLVEHLTEFLKQSDGIVKVGLEKTAKAIGVALEFLDTPAGKAAASITLLAAAVGVAKGAASAGSLLGAMGPAGAAITAFGAELSALAAPAIGVGIVIAALAVAFNDLKVTADGGDSVIRQIGKAFGDEEGSIQIAKDALDSFSGAMILTVMAGKQLVNTLGDIYDAIRPVLDVLKTIQDYTPSGVIYNDIVQGLGLDSWESFKGSWSKSAEGYRKAVRYAQGDPTIQYSQPLSGNYDTLTDPVLGGASLLGYEQGPTMIGGGPIGATLGYLVDRNREASITKRQRDQDQFVGPMAPYTGPDINPSITMNLYATSKADIANVAADEYKKQLIAWMAGVEGVE